MAAYTARQRHSATHEVLERDMLLLGEAGACQMSKDVMLTKAKGTWVLLQWMRTCQGFQNKV